MKVQLPNSFLVAGQAGIASILRSFRNYLDWYHDHSEGTQIVASAIPSGFGSSHITRASIATRNLDLDYVVDSEAAGTLAFGGGGAGTEVEDTALTNTVNFSIATNCFAVYTANKHHQIAPAAQSEIARVRFRVGSTNSGHSLVMANAQNSYDFGFSLIDVLSVPSGSQDIKVIWREETANTAQTIIAPRRVHLLFFAA